MQVCSKSKGKGADPIFPAHLQILPLEFLPESKPHKAVVKFTVCSSVTAFTWAVAIYSWQLFGESVEEEEEEEEEQLW